MSEPTEAPAGRTRGAWRQPRARAAVVMLGLAAAAAVISYGDGLFLVRRAGAVGRVDYLYPLLPDGLIVICLISVYDAAKSKVKRSGWATAGIVLGALLTVSMNLAAGLARSPLLALADGLVPVVFFVSAEVLNGHIRRGRAAAFPTLMGGGPAAPDSCPHTVSLTVGEAALQAFAHFRDCLGEPVTKTQLGARFDLSRKQVDALLPPVPKNPPAGAASEPPPLAPAGATPDGPFPGAGRPAASVNGQGASG